MGAAVVSQSASRFSPPAVRCEREKLEQAGWSEDVEVDCVGVMRVEKARAVGADFALPSVVEAGESLLVKTDGPPGAFHAAFGARLADHERDEDGERDKEPPER